MEICNLKIRLAISLLIALLAIIHDNAKNDISSSRNRAGQGPEEGLLRLHSSDRVVYACDLFLLHPGFGKSKNIQTDYDANIIIPNS